MPVVHTVQALADSFCTAFTLVLSVVGEMVDLQAFQ